MNRAGIFILGIASACLLTCATTLVYAGAADAAYRHPVVTASFGVDGTPATAFPGNPGQITIDQANNRLYDVESSSLYGFQLGAVGMQTPLGGSFPLTVPPAGLNQLAAENAGGDIFYLHEAFGTPALEGFDSTGATASGFPVGGFGDPCGVSLDSSGNPWVGDYGAEKAVEVSRATGELTGTTIDLSATGKLCLITFNRNNNDLFVAGYGGGLFKYTAAGGYTVHSQFSTRRVKAMAFDASKSTLYVIFEDAQEVVAFNASGTELEAFDKTSDQLNGVGVDESTGAVYVSNASKGKIEAYAGVVVPDVTTGPPVGNKEVGGTVDPAGAGTVTSCIVEYGNEKYEGFNPVQCTPAPPYTTSTNVTATLTGLEGDTTYHYRIVASNANGAGVGEDQTITPQFVHFLQTKPADQLSRNCATLHGSWEGNEEDTHYYFEYGTTDGYGTETAVPPGLDAGSSNTPVSVEKEVCGLQPGTTYHYRVVAANPEGLSKGADVTFNTVTAVEFLTTEDAEVLNATEAKVKGSWQGNGEDTHYYFEWGFTSAYGNTSPDPPGIDVGDGTGLEQESATLTGLIPATTYHYRIVASNVTGLAFGGDKTLATPQVPSIEALPAVEYESSEETGDGTTEVTLRAKINPEEGGPTTYHVDYGPTTAYGTSTAESSPAIPSDAEGHEVSVHLAGLTPGGVYHYRFVATSTAGVNRGADQTFTTIPDGPAVTASSVGAVGSTTATVNAVLSTGNGTTVYLFDYGQDIAYGKTTTTAAPIAADSGSHPVSSNLTGLAPNTTYHFRVVAINFAGVAYGPDQTFTTADVPTIISASAGSVTSSGATLSAEIVPNRSATAYHFEFGEEAIYGSSTAETAIGGDAAAHGGSAAISGLRPGTTYHYRVVATNGIGVNSSGDGTFTTAPEPVAVPTPTPTGLVCKKGFVKRHGKCVKKPKKKKHQHKAKRGGSRG